MEIHRTTKSLIFVQSVIDAMKKKSTVVSESDCVLPEGEPVRIMCEKSDGDCLVRSIISADPNIKDSVDHGWCLTSRSNISKDPDYSIVDPDSLFHRLKSRAGVVTARAHESVAPSVEVGAKPSFPQESSNYLYRSTEDFERGIDTTEFGFWRKKEEKQVDPRFTIE